MDETELQKGKRYNIVYHDEETFELFDTVETEDGQWIFDPDHEFQAQSPAPEPPSEPGWISVKDRLPESDSFCRVKLKNKEKSFDSHFYRDSYGEWWSSVTHIYDKNYTTRVTHWMPLSKGLKEESI